MFRTLGSLVLWLAVFGLVAFHLMNGPRSIFVREQILEEQTRLSQELEGVQLANAQLRSNLAGMQLETLNEDLLIERLHAMSLTLPGEMLLYTSE